MKKILLWTLLGVLLAGPAFAAPLQAVLVGDYRPLKTAEAEPTEQGFEATWLAGLSALVFADLRLENARSAAALRMGQLASGTAYYLAEPAALTAAKSGLADWAALAGEPFCVVAGSPHSALIASRFGGVPRVYPSAAQALIGLKLAECRAVVDDRVLLEQIAELPEWHRYNRLLPRVKGATRSLRIAAADKGLQQRIERVVASESGRERFAVITQHWIDEVAFQAYVLADTLDCH